MEKLSQRFGLWVGETMQRFFAVIGAGVLVVALNTLATLYMTRVLAPSVYGQWLYFLNWFGLWRLLMGLGLGPKIIKDLSETRQDVDALSRRFWPMLFVRVFTIVVFLTLAVGGGVLVHVSKLPASHVVYIVLAALAGALAVFTDSLLSTTAGLGEVRIHNLVLVIQPLSYSAAVWLALSIKPAVWVVVVVFMASYFVAFLAGGACIGRQRVLHLRRPTTEWRDLVGTLRFTGPMYGVSLLMYLFSVVGTLWLGWQQEYSAAAAFGVPLNLVLLPGSIAQTAVVSTFYPQMCALVSQGTLDKARALFDKFILRLGGGALLGSVILMVWPRDILRVVYSAQYAASAPVLSLLAPLVFLVIVELILVYTCIALGQLWIPMLGYGVQLLGVLLGVVGVSLSLVTPDVLASGLALIYVVMKIGGILIVFMALRQRLPTGEEWGV